MPKEPPRLDEFRVDGRADHEDFRDFAYRPALLQLRSSIKPPRRRVVLDQGREGSCTGFALATVINRLLAERGEKRTVSPRMLYEMAKKFDRWEGESYSGSSCRGAIRGWHNMGVCSDELAPYKDGETHWTLNLDQAKDARKTTLGAYYRVAKTLSHYHAALNEVGVLLVSARVHDGWRKQKIANGVIPWGNSLPSGGHAFAIVGYNTEGFYVQNSWGSRWGDSGVALWRYEDWLENVRDAWVVRLAVSTPQLSHLGPSAEDDAQPAEGPFRRKPRWAEVAGHFVHIDDGFFHDEGRYWSDLASVQETAKHVAESANYKHLLFYAHGGLNKPAASARRIVAMKETFKKNGIYPFHFMYDTGLSEEIRDVVFGRKKEIDERARGLSDYTDQLIEKAVRPAGRAIWREMKRDAISPFRSGMAGTETLGAFLRALAQPDATAKRLHLVGHSTGAILLASLLVALGKENDPPVVETCSLMAPACTHDLFERAYGALLEGGDSLKIKALTIYNLTDDLEKADRVTPLYRKSLLYLVSNSFEKGKGERILGMQKFRRYLPYGSRARFNIEVSRGRATPRAKTASTTHGGFDNDPLTMNSILSAILTKSPRSPFTADNLRY